MPWFSKTPFIEYPPHPIAFSLPRHHQPYIRLLVYNPYVALFYNPMKFSFPIARQWEYMCQRDIKRLGACVCSQKAEMIQLPLAVWTMRAAHSMNYLFILKLAGRKTLEIQRTTSERIGYCFLSHFKVPVCDFFSKLLTVPARPALALGDRFLYSHVQSTLASCHPLWKVHIKVVFSQLEGEHWFCFRKNPFHSSTAWGNQGI